MTASIAHPPLPRQRCIGASALLGLLCLCATAAAAAEAPITSVVVYADRAQVTRSRTADCAAGVAHFPGLPSTIDPKTLWATVAGNQGAVVGVTHEEEATGPKPRAELLQDQIRRLDGEIAAQNAALATAAALERKLASFRSHLSTIWGRQAAGPKPPTGTWDAALDLVRQQALAAGSNTRQAQARLRALSRQREELREDLRQVERERRRTTFRVTAHLRCTGQRTVQLSYVVPGATWSVSYQLRADPDKGRATLEAQALVQQGTGEDWPQTALYVSTANLQRRNIPPRMDPMRVSTHKPAEEQQVLVRRLEQREHLSTGKREATRQPSGGKLDDQRGEPAADADTGLALMLPAQGRVTVPSDGTKIAVTLERRALKASFTLETVPKLYPFVYHRVALNNPFSFPMLAGPVDLFRGRAFVGQAVTKQRAPGEPIALSLGVNPAFQVHRFVKREELEGSGVFGSKKRLHHRYVFQVGNWSRKHQKISVLENLPVSQLREINVSLTDDATKPTRWERNDGILTWVLDLPPRSKRTITLGYTVTLPDSYVVSGY